MGDFREGVLWRYDPRRGSCSGSRPTASRATSPRSATRSTSRSTATPSRVGRALRRRDGRAQGQPRPARVRARVGRRRGLGGGLPVRGPPQHRRSRRLRTLRQIFLPFQPPGRRVDGRASSSASCAVGAGSLWVLGDALDRRVWRLDPRSGDDPGHDRAARSRRARWSWRAARPGSPTALHDTVVPVDARSNRVLPAVRGRPRRRRRHRRRRRRLGGERDRRDGLARSIRAAAGSRRRSMSAGARARSTPATAACG